MMFTVAAIVVCISTFSRGTVLGDSPLNKGEPEIDNGEDKFKINSVNLHVGKITPSLDEYWDSNDDSKEIKLRNIKPFRVNGAVTCPIVPKPVPCPEPSTCPAPVTCAPVPEPVPCPSPVTCVTVPALCPIPAPRYNKIWTFIVGERKTNSAAHKVCFNFDNKLKGDGGCLLIKKTNDVIRYGMQYMGQIVKDIKIKDDEDIPQCLLPRLPEFERFFVSLNVKTRTRSTFEGCVYLHFGGLPRDGMEASCFNLKRPAKKSFYGR